MFGFISQNIEVILIGVVAIFLFWNIFLELRLKKESQRTSSFFKGRKANDLEEVLSETLKKQRDAEDEIKEILEKIKNLDEVALRSIQKVGVVRFNPFKEIGGNQSFSLVILDQKDDGVVISSYHSKEGTRIYTKPIKQGESSFPLSGEEEEAIKKAMARD
jgi:hypothetical protein